MSLLLAISDFSAGEGVYTAELVAQLAPRVGPVRLALLKEVRGRLVRSS